MKPFLFIVFLFLMGCSSYFKYDFWDKEDFTFCEKKSQSTISKIKVLYTSYGESEEAYVHTVAVDQETMDTINILSVNVMRFNSQDVDNILGYSRDYNNIEDKYNKVFRDARFDDIADNDFCTFYGSIGTMISDVRKNLDSVYQINIEDLYKDWTITLVKINRVDTELKERNFIKLEEHICSFNIEPLGFKSDFNSWRMQAPKHFTLNTNNSQQTFEIISLEQNKLILNNEAEGVYMELISE